MITKVTKNEVLVFSGRILTGIFANPVNSNLATDSYSRQGLIGQVLQDTINAFLANSITIDDDEMMI